MNEIELIKLYDLLIKEKAIAEIASSKKAKIEIVTRFLNTLEQLYIETIVTGNLEPFKNISYERYVIKESDIPDNYWHYIENMYLKEGRGYFNLREPQDTEDKDKRYSRVTEIQKEQQESLSVWIEYFFSENSKYMAWNYKLWAFFGMLKIGTLNKEKTSYNRRTKNVVAPFVPLDIEVLGKTVAYYQECLEKKKDCNFKTVYGTLLIHKKEVILNGDEGIWVKYCKGSEEDAVKLYCSLQGYNTGWCTAGSLEVAKNQVCGGDTYVGGDFYVYYSKDKTGGYKIPRLAIRMEYNLIAEVRGIASEQNIEANMEYILKEKLNKFSDSERYLKKVSDMRMLTTIYNKFKQEELTLEDLRFIYEIDSKILGFGFTSDPRINEIIRCRDIKDDLSHILGCKKEEIGIEPEKGTNKDLVYYFGNLNLECLSVSQGEVLPLMVKRDVDLKNLVNATNITFPKIIGGNLVLRALVDASYLTFPEEIGGNLITCNLKKATKTIFPRIIKGHWYLDSLTIDELLDASLPEYFFSIYIEGRHYSFEELKEALNIRRVKRDSNNLVLSRCLISDKTTTL